MSDQPLTLFTYSRSGGSDEDRWAHTGIPSVFFDDLQSARRSVLDLRDDIASDAEGEWPSIDIEKIEIIPLTRRAIIALLNGGVGAIVSSREIIETIS